MKKLFFLGLLALSVFLFFEGNKIDAILVVLIPIAFYFSIYILKKLLIYLKLRRAAKYLEKQEISKGVSILKKMQTQEAYHLLGLVYKGDKVFDKEYIDSEEAIKFFGKAAHRGNALSQYELAVMYFYGLGVEQNNIQAYIWLSILAEYKIHKKAEVKAFLNKLEERITIQEKAEAQSQISRKFAAAATLHLRNYNKAEKYLFKAAENGHPNSMLLLVLFYGGIPEIKGHPLAKFFSKDIEKMQEWNQKILEQAGTHEVKPFEEMTIKEINETIDDFAILAREEMDRVNKIQQEY